MNQKIIIASGPVIVEHNKVLLNQHGDSNEWKFCGGKVENFEENLIKTAEREVKEEMGIEIDVLLEEPFITYRKKETEQGAVDVILVHYGARRVGEIKPGPDIRAWNWFELDQLPDNLAPNIIPALKHFGYLK
ncbi:MAG: hypothetical protein COY66_05435 [Candidatus Kerfeldbacteria bacterium CG_4_10_14_0_8_um_filter_42_10]|uniref:Nudix hydrolase domain-containing protein n=1 Tax=Candidatus Kerfeldbacteria bacterium CG_4_10_14_0_8_um_filter_42_10 TaxID=2014248 RepID=A0A2M7RGS1_9BACT|nr:MAG: hypothetical protein COY66_05435 [Candidatus Kerfeldbacteria bacterium CG_4_10_14_0_8_um_filter_42_10]